jgi:predicted NAD-dependent protein-ADP-ribosyltransferase YbiA (DUF1768 family)
MLEVLAVKFDQCEKFRNYFCSTKNRQLIHNVADGFCGSGRNGWGKIIQGKLLMQFRDKMVIPLA